MTIITNHNSDNNTLKLANNDVANAKAGKMPARESQLICFFFCLYLWLAEQLGWNSWGIL